MIVPSPAPLPVIAPITPIVSTDPSISELPSPSHSTEIADIEEISEVLAPEQSFTVEGPQGETVNLKEKWPEFLDVVLRDRPNLGSFLSLAHIVDSSTNSIDLKFGPMYRFQHTEITRKANRDEIDRMLHEFVGHPAELRITIETRKLEIDGQNYISQVTNVTSTINDEIEAEPIIQTVLEMFDGEVLK